MLKQFKTFLFLLLVTLSAGIAFPYEKYQVTFTNGSVYDAIFVSSSPSEDKTFCVIRNDNGTLVSGYYDVEVVRTMWGK